MIYHMFCVVFCIVLCSVLFFLLQMIIYKFEISVIFILLNPHDISLVIVSVFKGSFSKCLAVQLSLPKIPGSQAMIIR